MEAVPRVELGSPDSESGVITTTLHSPGSLDVGIFLAFIMHEPHTNAVSARSSSVALVEASDDL